MHDSSASTGPTHGSRWSTTPRRRPAWYVAGAASLVLPVLLLGPGVASAADDQQLTLDGTVVSIAVDAMSGPSGPSADMLTRVEVGDELVPLPEPIAQTAADLAGDVELTVLADQGMTPDEVTSALADGAPTDVARVVGVAAGAASGVRADTLAGSLHDVIGTHVLTVIPVYWSSPDATSTDAFRSWAQGTAAYWSAQSAGRIAVQVDVRAWTQIADPGSCDESAMFNAAVSASGITTVDNRHHVVVYFPHRSDCGWDGLGSVWGGRIWVNGSTVPDILSHELGHNFGLGHANTATCTTSGGRVSLLLPVTQCARTEYGDEADVMGIGIASLPTGNLNTALADTLGLVDAVRLAPGASTTVNLAPLGDVTAVRSIAIPVSTGVVYVDFRPFTGRDLRVPAWAGVQVHLQVMAGSGSGAYPVSYLLDMTPATPSPFRSAALAPGASWQVPGTGLVVTVRGVGSLATVSVGPVAAPVPTQFTGVLSVDSPAVRRAGTTYLRASYTTGGADVAFPYGNPGDVAVMGDWDGNGSVTPGVFRGGMWYLRNSNGIGAADVVVAFGSPGDVPVVGDWNGDGVDTMGVFRNGVWYLRNSITSGAADVAYRYGSPGDVPVVGDWNGDGSDTFGVFRSGSWYLTNTPASGIAEGVYGFGQPGDVPLAGDWNGDGIDTIGVFRGGHWYLTNRLDSGVAEGWFDFGSPGDVPLLFR